MTQHLSEEQLILHYYGEAREGEVDMHLDGCDTCRGQYRALQRVLNAADSFAVPDPGAQFEAAVWQRLEQRLPKRSPAARLRAFFQPRQWAMATALAAMFVVAFYAGRHSQQQELPPAQTTAFDSRMLLSAVGNHFDRSQMILAELANEPEAPMDEVRDLLEANRLYRASAGQAGELEIADTLDELERLLIEVAHQTPNEELRRRILDQGIILKMRLAGAQLREREKIEY
ncbi:MAG: hypothetical protein JNL62_04895 [Bryobacterales bacterium]|nr:hypothetical protein [Bryobacterales bacterium]